MAPESSRPTAPVTAADLDLLRKFEPVVCYTRGEQFFPTDIDHYVKQSSFWEHHPDGRDELLVREGELTLEKMVEPRLAEFGSVRYLRFIEALTLTESARVLADQARLRRQLGESFHPGIGRLARGGILPRLLDGLFSLSFLIRGKVSAANAAAAELDYNEILSRDNKYPYYGRVTRQSGWTVLQYWFFFSFDSWRSGFHGVNDHEADWEMITLYLYEQDGQLIPEWAAYATHDFKGDDLRRRWDDRDELNLTPDGHPLVFAGAGSHASYFRKGEYQAEVNPALPGWLPGLVHFLDSFWTGALGQPPAKVFHIPFVDFARGDGLRIGPGESQTWSPVVIDESTPWVSQYRGLWGLFARDPISGENAPAGPMYNRDGSPRGSWYDPLGFAGLDKVPPPPKLDAMLFENIDQLTRRQRVLDGLLTEKSTGLQEKGVSLKGMEGNPYLAKQYAALEREITFLSAELHGFRREQSENSALLQGLARRMEFLRAGGLENPRSHIHVLAAPDDPSLVLRFDRAAETWAAVSLSLLMFAIAVLILFAPSYLWASLAVILVLFVVAESFLRGAFVQTIGRVTLILAMVAAVILFLQFWKIILLVALLTMGLSLMYHRLREIAG